MNKYEVSWWDGDSTVIYRQEMLCASLADLLRECAVLATSPEVNGSVSIAIDILPNDG